MKELHEAIIRTESRLDQAVENNLQFYADILRVHLGKLLEAMGSKLSREVKELCGVEVSYSIKPELAEKLDTLDEWAAKQEQLPQDNQEAFAAAVDYADGWRPWSGGECPHDGDVDIRLRSNIVYSGPSIGFRWKRGSGDWAELDIVAWRPA